MYMFATNATELYIANIMVGLVGGGTLALMPLFVAEIASDRLVSVYEFKFYQLGWTNFFKLL